MNISKLTIAALAAIAVAMAFAVVPALTSAAYATKTVTEEECIGVGGDFEECPGESGGRNPNREQQECSVTGGGGDPVRGQEKKLCD